MRSKKSISETLNQIKLVWEKYPNLRLLQLLDNATYGNNMFYIEDEKVIELLLEFAKRHIDIKKKD
jgi:hypothetical protein